MRRLFSDRLYNSGTTEFITGESNVIKQTFVL